MKKKSKENIMKRISIFITLITLFACLFSSCSLLGGGDHLHSFAEWHTTKNPTCTEIGEIVRYCSCGEKQSEVIPELGHQYADGICTICGSSTPSAPCQHTNKEIISAIEPTCVTEGLTEGEICADCGKVLKAQETVAKADHTPTEPVKENETSSGCNEGASYDRVVYCAQDGCGAELSRETVTTTGTHTYENNICTFCGWQAPGLYDSSDNMLASWDVLTGEYGMRIDMTDLDLNSEDASSYLAAYVLLNFPDGTKLVISDDVEYIGIASFAFTTLEEVVIPDSVTKIGYGAFMYCQIKQIHIPKSVIELGTNLEYEGEYLLAPIIAGCPNLESITVSEENPVYKAEDNVLFSKDGKKLLIYANKKGDTSYTIPYGVEEISPLAFIACTNLINIEIPDTVQTIGLSCFLMCTALESITLPEGITEIPDSAFSDCSSLKTVNLPSTLVSIGDSAFAYTEVSSITFPDSLTSIGERAFVSCPLSLIRLNENVTIGDEAFYNTAYYQNKSNWVNGMLYINNRLIGVDSSVKGTIVLKDNTSGIDSNVLEGYNLTFDSIAISEDNEYYKTINGVLYTKDGKTLIRYAPGKTDTEFIIPDGVTTIAEYAFSRNSYITKITLPDSVTTIGDSAFSNCLNLVSINIPEGVTTIPTYIFNNCSSLREVNIPSTVTEIGEGAFSFCTQLDNVILPDGLISIGDDAFLNCTALTVVNIPASTVSIGEDAYRQCSSISIITVDENNPSYMAIDNVLYTKDGKTLIKYASGSKNTYFVIPDGVEVVCTSAFYGATSLTSVVIPEGVEIIRSITFSGCTSLSTVVIPKSVTTIEANAFGQCPLSLVFYRGTEEEWAQVYIEKMEAFGNIYLNGEIYKATIYYNYN